MQPEDATLPPQEHRDMMAKMVADLQRANTPHCKMLSLQREQNGSIYLWGEDGAPPPSAGTPLSFGPLLYISPIYGFAPPTSFSSKLSDP